MAAELTQTLLSCAPASQWRHHGGSSAAEAPGSKRASRRSAPSWARQLEPAGVTCASSLQPDPPERGGRSRGRAAPAAEGGSAGLLLGQEKHRRLGHGWAASASPAAPPAEAPALGEADQAAPPGARNVVDILKERGLVEALTSEELRDAASRPNTAPLKAYVGFDPTAESLHLGNLLGIIVLSWFQRCGHIPVALVGGATARVGDPSGKSVERPIMDEATIERNLAGIRAILTSVLADDNGSHDGKLASDAQAPLASGSGQSGSAGGDERAATGNSAAAQRGRHKPIFVNNYDWWKDVSVLEFLRDVGKYARVGVMMAKETVKKRLQSEEGLSYTEFTYQLLQGYDFVHMHKNLGVTVQMGGSDQWGNITAGTDLVRRLIGGAGEGSTGDGPLAYGLTWPLLLKSDGSKFGKSEGGAIWLAASMLSPYKFYQYLFATPDADVITFMKILTFMELSEIEEYAAEMTGPKYTPNRAQRRLAEEVTRFVHGEAGLQEAISATRALAPGAATKLDAAALEAIAEDIPSKVLPLDQVQSVPLIDVAVAAGLFASKGAARRLLQQGGVYLNNEKVESVEAVINEDDLVGGKMLLLAAGKKNKLLVRLQ